MMLTCVQESYAVGERKLRGELRGCSVWEEQAALQDTPENPARSAPAGCRGGGDPGASVPSGPPRLQDGPGVIWARPTSRAHTPFCPVRHITKCTVGKVSPSPPRVSWQESWVSACVIDWQCQPMPANSHLQEEAETETQPAPHRTRSQRWRGSSNIT